MNILVTGSTGFLGKEIVSQNTVHQIFKLNRKIGDYKFDLCTTKPKFNFGFDIVIHNAGMAHSVPKTIEEKNSFYDVNVKGTSNLLRGLEIDLPKQFVFISSVAVYGLYEGELIDENKPLLASDPYGLSKIQAEKLVQEWCKLYNVVCTILRLPLVVGENPPGNLGTMIKAINKGYYFNIAGGKAKKSMVLAEDVAKSILQMASVGGVYNLTDGYHPNFNELSTHIASQFGKKSVYNLPLWAATIVAYIGDFFVGKFPLNTDKLNKIRSTLTFDDTKARESFGWNPIRVIDGFNLKHK